MCKHMAFYLIGMNIVILNQRKYEHLSTYVGFLLFFTNPNNNKWDFKSAALHLNTFKYAECRAKIEQYSMVK